MPIENLFAGPHHNFRACLNALEYFFADILSDEASRVAKVAPWAAAERNEAKIFQFR